MSAFEDRVLGRIFVPKRDGMQEDGGMWIAGSMRACSKMSLM
jgi:hypothetical protein